MHSVCQRTTEILGEKNKKIELDKYENSNKKEVNFILYFCLKYLFSNR